MQKKNAKAKQLNHQYKHNTIKSKKPSALNKDFIQAK